MHSSRSLRRAAGTLAGASALTAAAAALLIAPGAGATPSSRAAAAGAPCTTGQLAVRFTAVAGSAGAGNIVYALQVRNIFDNVCSVTGLPRLQLLDAKGKPLPTTQRAAQPGMGTAIFVPLQPGESAWAAVRFSPDVPGPGEGGTGPCEPKAFKIRATVGTEAAVATGPIVPATPVCSKGALSVGLLSRVKPKA